MNILSADFGTSSLKMAVLDEAGRFLRSAKVGYSCDIDGDRAEIDPEAVYKAFIEGCRQLYDLISSVEALVFCSFCPSLIPMDGEGEPLFPAVLHLDRRSYKQSRSALDLAGRERFLEINGNLPFAGGISCTSMLWIKENRPEIYDRTYKLGHLSTFLHKRLTGKWLIDPTNASFTGLFETLSFGGWSDELCSALSIDKGMLPDIAPSNSMAGALLAQAARDTGLKQGIPVLTGANDSSAAAYGAERVKKGDILNISGSSEIMVVTTDKPVPSGDYLLRASAQEGKWLYIFINVGGFALEWFRRQFCREMGASEFYEDYLPKAAAAEMQKGLKFAPHLSGDRHSLIKKTGSFSGLNLKTTREDMLLALLSGTYGPMLKFLDGCGRQFRLNPRIITTGGLAFSPFQDFKNRMFKGFEFIKKEDCSALGNIKFVRGEKFK